jgi:hypothetical protein
MNNLKTCTTCNQVHPITEFSKSIAKKDGVSNKCKPCVRAAWHATVARQKERQKEQQLQEAIARRSDPNLAQPIRPTVAVTLPGTPGAYYRNLQPQHIRGI